MCRQIGSEFDCEFRRYPSSRHFAGPGGGKRPSRLSRTSRPGRSWWDKCRRCAPPAHPSGVLAMTSSLAQCGPTIRVSRAHTVCSRKDAKFCFRKSVAGAGGCKSEITGERHFETSTHTARLMGNDKWFLDCLPFFHPKLAASCSAVGDATRECWNRSRRASSSHHPALDLRPPRSNGQCGTNKHDLQLGCVAETNDGVLQCSHQLSDALRSACQDG